MITFWVPDTRCCLALTRTCATNCRNLVQVETLKDGTGCEIGSLRTPPFRGNDDMPVHRKSPATPAPTLVSTAVRSDANRTKSGGRRATTKRWRREVRPQILRSTVVATESLPWSPALLELLFEELYVDGSLEEVLGSRPRELQKRRYPQAIAVALVLRHSWLPQDLACILERLGLPRGSL